MEGFSLPVHRPRGRALVVGSSDCRAAPVSVLKQLGFQTAEAGDPYSAMAELSQQPRSYQSLIVSLASLYREELPIISVAKRLGPHLEVWLTHSDGRAAALAEASRLGADGLLSEDGFHRFAMPAEQGSASTHLAPIQTVPASAPLHSEPAVNEPEPAPTDEPDPLDLPISEPILTAEELRALLQEQPVRPAVGTEGS